ncbi:hypothetical protein OHB54_26200 [Streptomyces sp. NBC_01007]|nr:hypothetical protein OHB54_26200 [Streptomyces sp. NBC_01007]
MAMKDHSDEFRTDVVAAGIRRRGGMRPTARVLEPGPDAVP